LEDAYLIPDLLNRRGEGICEIGNEKCVPRSVRFCLGQLIDFRFPNNAITPRRQLLNIY